MTESKRYGSDIGAGSAVILVEEKGLGNGKHEKIKEYMQERIRELEGN